MTQGWRYANLRPFIRCNATSPVLIHWSHDDGNLRHWARGFVLALDLNQKFRYCLIFVPAIGCRISWSTDSCDYERVS